MTLHEEYGSIIIEAATLTSDGLQPGSAEKKFMHSPAQGRALIDRLDRDVDALEALYLIVEHGELRLDPLRIEVPGWGRDWLIERGMTVARARKVTAILTKRNFMTKTYGPLGAAGGTLGVLAGSAFGWQDATEEIISPITGRPRLVVAGSDIAARHETTPQVSAFGRSVTKRAASSPTPVDNAFGHPAAECVSVSSHSESSAPNDQTAEWPVGPFGDSATERASTPPSRKEEEEKVLLLRGSSGAALPLTRSALLHLLFEPEVTSVLCDREADSIAAFARVFSRSTISARGACEHLGIPVHNDPAQSLAWFTYRALTADADGRADLCSRLREQYRATKTRIEAKGPLNQQELIGGTILALVVAQDSEPRSWPAYVVSMGRNQDDYGSSTSVRSLVDAINSLVFMLPTEVPTVRPRSVEAASPLAAFGPPPGVSTRADLSPSEREQLQRGDGYWQWMVETVLPGTEYDGPANEALVRDSRNIQNGLIQHYYRSHGA